MESSRAAERDAQSRSRINTAVAKRVFAEVKAKERLREHEREMPQAFESLTGGFLAEKLPAG